MSSLLLLTLPKLLRGTRDRWVAQVSFIIIHSTGLAPFPRLSAPPHSSQYSLKLHQKRHTGVREYMCFQCEKTFITSNQLKRHEMIHAGEKPYMCSHYDKRFSQLETLKTHERIHTGEKPYHCTACGKSFRHSSNLFKHKKNIHSTFQHWRLVLTKHDTIMRLAIKYLLYKSVLTKKHQL